jgi:GNAT superfamily N-acetyltransferase
MIRLAALSDVDDIARLNVKAWQAAYRGHMPDAHLDQLDPSKRAAIWSKAIGQLTAVVLVATAGETLVGFCSLLPSRDADASPVVGEISAIYVAPTVWRSGIGSSLIEGTIEAARERDFSDLTLWVLTSNTSARAFDETRGFEVDATLRLKNVRDSLSTRPDIGATSRRRARQDEVRARRSNSGLQQTWHSLRSRHAAET